MTILSKKNSQPTDKPESPGQNNPRPNVVAPPTPQKMPELSGESDGGDESCAKRHAQSSPDRVGRSRDRAVRKTCSSQPGPSCAPEIEAVTSGYNSGDEYGYCDVDWTAKEACYLEELKTRGFVVKYMKEDGACLFRAVADQLYGDQEMHYVVRQQCMDHISKYRSYYCQFVTENMDNYIARKRLMHTHGNHIEIQAMCEIFQRCIEVFSFTKKNHFSHRIAKVKMTPIIRRKPSGVNRHRTLFVSYERGSHYNSLTELCKPDLTRPSLSFPEVASESTAQENEVKAIQQKAVEQTMMEDTTDMETTNDEHMSRESYLAWLGLSEKDKKKEASTQVIMEPGSAGIALEHTYSKSFCEASTSCDMPSTSGICKNASFMNDMSPTLFGLSNWDEMAVLSDVLAKSQEEYLQKFKSQKCEEKGGEALKAEEDKAGSSEFVQVADISGSGDADGIAIRHDGGDKEADKISADVTEKSGNRSVASDGYGYLACEFFDNVGYDGGDEYDDYEKSQVED